MNSSELTYFIRVMAKMHMQVHVLSVDQFSSCQADFGLRRLLGFADDFREFFKHSNHTRENTIYKLHDEFACHYCYLILPHTEPLQVMLLGPYTTSEISHARLMEMAEALSVSVQRLPQMRDCFSHIPFIQDELMLFFMLSTLGESLWGGRDAFKIVDVNMELSPVSLPPAKSDDSSKAEELFLRMKLMEMRYAYENQLVEMIAKGHRHRVEQLMLQFSKQSFEQRTTDPLRNLKNYGIVCNTLMRKAAEQGHVHPIDLDRVSSAFARKVEALNTLSDVHALIPEMAHTYCRLVQKYADRHYSPIIQKTVAYIESDLTCDLRLHTLSTLLNVSPGYLSTLFHEETGKTLSHYVNERRMEHAAKLLRTTRLQVQTIAQHCGISDANYFSRLFKQHHGVTPHQLRAEAQAVHIKIQQAK